MGNCSSVIRPGATRLWAWLVGAVLTAVRLGLEAAVKATNALSGALAAWAQAVSARTTANSLAAARRAKASDRWRTAFESAPVAMARVGVDGR